MRYISKSLHVAFACVAWITLHVSPAFAADTGEIQFNRDILPILSKHCMACHGPDPEQRKADLRLDTQEGLLASVDDGSVILPGQPEKSLLIERIRSHDPDDVMPPPEAKNPMTEEQVKLLVDWVRQGAKWEGHWAFTAPRVPTLPALKDMRWVQNPIDRFILASLETRGLAPNQEADRATLVRRVAYDLTGLPPATEEVAAFRENTDTNAYEQMLDHYLNSQKFGERMALAWMDLARYGDSSVYHADGPRFMWLWRDYVINAYNDNKPFDAFTIEQLAGDLIPGADTWQKVASGFNRNHGTTDEGGAIAEEYRVEYIVDRVKTTSMVWLGLTMECAQCHQHKYDPISQKEYYQFYAFFNQASDKGMQTRNGNEPPFVRFFETGQQARHESLSAQIASLKKRHNSSKPDLELVRAWALEEQVDSEPEMPEVSVWKQLGPLQGGDKNTLFAKDFGPEKALDLDAEIEGKGWEDKKSYKDGEVVSLGLPDNAVSYLYRTLTCPEDVTIDVSFGSDDAIKCWLNSSLVLENNANRGAAADQDTATLQLKKGDNAFLMKIVNGGGASGFYFKMQGSTLPGEVLEVLKVAAQEWDDAQFKVLEKHYQATVWPEGLERRARITGLEEEEKGLLGLVPTSMIMGDLDEGRDTYLLMRGHYASPVKDEVIKPGVPAFLPGMPKNAPGNRLGMAQWLTDPAHPLTARVAVNRYWSMFFGRGIVPTVEDFGTRGAWPSHPDLLDWLARDFVDHGWDIKRTIKQLLMSATYRQSTHVSGLKQELDPENTLLSRGPRRRHQGEFIRDSTLMLAGILNEKVGGPSVKPYQPPRIWNEVSLDGNLKYQRDKGQKLYRRSMYTYWKRSAPMPNMMAFDAPTREKCVIQRQVTNTPLQALVTMNDEQFIEATRLFAERIIREGGNAFESRLNHAFMLASARPADTLRQQVLRKFHDRQLAIYQSDSDRAKALLEVGDYPHDEGLDAAELAAWTMTASAILNLDEVLTH
jgi:mono/diheme cytochrome c family protein